MYAHMGMQQRGEEGGREEGGEERREKGKEGEREGGKEEKREGGEGEGKEGERRSVGENKKPPGCVSTCHSPLSTALMFVC